MEKITVSAQESRALDYVKPFMSNSEIIKKTCLKQWGDSYITSVLNKMTLKDICLAVLFGYQSEPVTIRRDNSAISKKGSDY